MAIHRRIGYLPGEFNLYDRLTGAETIEYFANLRGGLDRAYMASLIERLGLDPWRRFREYSQGQQAEGRPHLRPPASAGAADPRRADRRAGPARPADLQSRSCSRPRRKAGPSSSRRTSSARSSGPATGSRSSATAGSSGSTPSRPSARWPPTRWSCASPEPVDPTPYSAVPGVTHLVVEGRTLRMRVTGPIAPVVRLAAQGHLVDFVSREPIARGGLPRRVRNRERAAGLMSVAVNAGPPRRGRGDLPASRSAARLMGLGSVFGKALRDCRRTALLLGGLSSR